ncbi:MAG TPA: response regulator transcription factor [Intrasporangium sp.]|uniref:response regulator transcription factor n=1 Tax=Intrasporangium sp. TaxID=1925024 RepID=UPI002D79674F|nr:response regulator transcription factor [Intrasporangium sp.]HET7399210.1 response regulator transcription factor [Intrasporangium sp.]
MTDTAAPRVAVVDDHPAIRLGTLEGLRQHLPQLSGAISVSTVPELLTLLRDPAEPPDVVLLDVSLADGSVPAENTRRLTDAGVRVLLYTQDSRPGVVSQCFRAGALGLVGKHEGMEVLAEAVRAVSSGEPYLSAQWAAALDADSGWAVPQLAPRELEALRLYATGIAVKSVARRMQISPETVREYLLRVRRKYEQAGRPAATKSDLYFRAVEDGHLPPAPGA